MPKKPDRRVQRTHQLLRQSLLSLIRERGFEDLSVQDIIDRADVGRATFYAHFENKDDLLMSGFEELRASLRDRQRRAHARGRAIDERVLAFSHEMFAHANEYGEVFRAMVGKRSGAAVRRLLHKLLSDLVRDDLESMTPDRRKGAVPTEASVQFIAGGLLGLLVWWLEGRQRLSVDEVEALFRRMAIPALSAAVKASARLAGAENS